MTDKLKSDVENRYNITDDELRFICSCYNIGSLVEYNRNFTSSPGACIKLLTTEGSFVLRFSCSKSDRIEYIKNVLSTLKSNNLPVLIPFVNNKSTYHMHIGKGRAVQITEFVESSTFDYSEKQFNGIGKMLRRFHEVLKDFKNGPLPETSIYASNTNLLEGFKKLHEMKHSLSVEHIKTVDKLYDQLVQKWDSMYSNLPTSIIHGDWSTKNLLFDKNENVCCILDFDFIQRAERIYDVAYLLWFGYNSGFGKNLLRAFTEGYGSMEPEEKIVIPNIMARLSLFFICCASMNPKPLEEFRNQFEKQLPIINWLMSGEGISEISSLL